MVTTAFLMRAPEGNLAVLVNKVIEVNSSRNGIDKVTEGLVIAKYHEHGTCYINPVAPKEGYEFMQVGVLVYGYSNDIWWFPRSVLRFYGGNKNHAPFAIIGNARSKPMTPRQIDHVTKGSPLDGILYNEFSEYLAGAGIQPPPPRFRNVKEAISAVL